MDSEIKGDVIEEFLKKFKSPDPGRTSQQVASGYYFRKCAYCGREEKDAPIGIGRYNEPLCFSCSSELIQHKLDYEILADEVTHQLKFLMTSAGNENLVWNKQVKIKVCVNLQCSSPFDRLYSTFRKWWKRKGGLVWIDCLCLASVDKDNPVTITTQFKLATEKKGLGAFASQLFCILIRAAKFLLAFPDVHKGTLELKCRTDVPLGIAVGGIVYAVILDYLLNDPKFKSKRYEENEALAAWYVVHYLHIMDYDQYGNYYDTLLKKNSHPLKMEYEKICSTSDPLKENRIRSIGTFYK